MRSSTLLAVVYFTLLVITLVALPSGAVRAQGSADVNLEQQIQAALARAGFDPGPADGKFGPKTRRAISAWQRANRHAATGFLTGDQLRTILAGTTLSVTLEPKCEALPGRYLGENHAECWEEIKNQTGCFLWRTHYHSDQTTRWTGQCRRGVAEGQGMYSVSAGSEHGSYEGTGRLANGKANGLWFEIWANGDRCEREQRDGQPRHGTCTWANGTHYEGEFRDGKRHGNGVWTWPNGDRYEGEFRDGLLNGNGVWTWPNGDRYEGEYRDGKRHGRGTFTLHDGSRYVGGWRDGEKHGHGVLSGNGNRHEGEYRDGKPHGYGTYIFANGTRLQGQWRNGCFKDPNGWAAVDTTPAACGFE